MNLSLGEKKSHNDHGEYRNRPGAISDDRPYRDKYRARRTGDPGLPSQKSPVVMSLVLKRRGLGCGCSQALEIGGAALATEIDLLIAPGFAFADLAIECDCHIVSSA